MSLPRQAEGPAIRPKSEDRIRAALWFAERGFGIVPLWSTDDDGTCRCPKGRACDSRPGKHPMALVVPNGVKDATTDPSNIRIWLSYPSEPNYGITPPKGTIALDVDGEGLARFAALEQSHGPMPPTLRDITPNGEHVFVHLNGRDPGGDLFGFVTRRHRAGYVVGPHSWHPSGKAYGWNGVQDIADMPDSWIDALPRRDPDIITVSGGYELPARIAEGQRYDAVRDFTAHLYKKGIAERERWELVRAVMPPRFDVSKPEAELRADWERAERGMAERLGPPRSEDGPEPAPAPAAAADWPAPPADAAYHGVLGDIVRAVEPYTEADPIGIMATLLVMFGTACGDARWFYQGSMQAANLFVVLVGSTSFGGRKGTSYGVARDVFGRAYPLDGLYIPGVASGEGITGHFTRNTRRDPDAASFEPVEPRALVLETEFGRLLTIMSREGSTLSPVLRNAWDRVPLGFVKAREEALVTRHHLSLLGHITPPELRTKLTDTDAANGFANRILWVAVRRSRLVPRPESPGRLVQPYLGRLADAIEAALQPFEMTFDSEAAERWDWFYAEMALTARLGLAGAITARHEAQVARLALVYALTDAAGAIGAAHLEAAIAFAAYARRSAVWAFGDSTGNRHADVLRRMLIDGPVPWTDAKHALGLRLAADVEQAVGVLVDAGLAEVVDIPQPKGGRPRREIRAKGAKGAKGAGPAREDGKGAGT